MSELSVPLPHKNSHNPFNNPIDLKAYERLLNEFDIYPSSHPDFRQYKDKNRGFGDLYLYALSNLYTDGGYVPGITPFYHNSRVPLVYIRQKFSNAWTTLILNAAKGHTRAGVERLNDSIRTYVWCILCSQGQTRSNIIEESIRFDDQKQFLANLYDAINAEVDLPSSIKRYQDTLRYARSKLNFAVGTSLYLIPSDL